MPQIGDFAVRIVMIVVWVLGSCSDSRCVFGNTTQDAMIDELSDIMKKEVDELILNLERVESLDDFNKCVRALSFYGEFAETSLPQIVQLLKGNVLRRNVPSAFGEENFRLGLLQYFDSISASAIVPLIELAADSSLDQRTREVASEAIGIVAKNSRVKSSSLASMIENTLANESAEKNSKLYHNLLRSYCELVEPSDTTQAFLLQIIASNDFQAKMFGIEILCMSHRKSPIVLKAIIELFQEQRNSSELRVNRPHSIVQGYGDLGLFDETFDSFLSFESLESDAIWRIKCLESMINTRADSVVPRTRLLTELQYALNTRPVSPANSVIINRVLSILEDWDLEHLKDAELLLVDCVEESSLDDLRAVAFELLDKLNSDRSINLASLAAKSQNRSLRLLALKQLHFKQRSLDAEDMSFLIEFAVSGDEFLDYRVDALTIIEALPKGISANLDRLGNVWQIPGPPELRFAAYRACNRIRN
jgi:hypothetical protein